MFPKLKSRSKHIFDMYTAYKEFIRTGVTVKKYFVEKRVLTGLGLK